MRVIHRPYTVYFTDGILHRLVSMDPSTVPGFQTIS